MTLIDRLLGGYWRIILLVNDSIFFFLVHVSAEITPRKTLRYSPSYLVGRIADYIYVVSLYLIVCYTVEVNGPNFLSRFA